MTIEEIRQLNQWQNNPDAPKDVWLLFRDTDEVLYLDLRRPLLDLTDYPIGAADGIIYKENNVYHFFSNQEKGFYRSHTDWEFLRNMFR